VLENILFKFSKILKLTVFSSVVEISPRMGRKFQSPCSPKLFYLLG